MGSALVRRAWRWLARTDVFAYAVVAVLILIALGSCFPQVGPEVASRPERLAEWRALVHARYGSLAVVLESLGAFSLYRSPTLWAMTGFLALVTLACTLQRWRANWGAAFHAPVRLPEAALEGAPCRAVVQGVPADSGPGQIDGVLAIACAALRQRDYRVRCDASAEPRACRGDRNRWSSLGTLAEHVAVLIVLLGVALSASMGWRETITVGPGKAHHVARLPGLALRNDGFVIERYSDGSPAAYIAQVTVIENEVPASRLVGVNQPLTYRGLRVYLTGYRQGENGYDVTLLAVRDPGFVAVVAAGFLFLAGMIISLYFPRSTIAVRREEGGVVRVAGWADHRAYDFEREFAGLVADLRRVLEGARQGAAGPDG